MTQEQLFITTLETRFYRNGAASVPEVPGDRTFLQRAAWTTPELSAGREVARATAPTAPAGESRSVTCRVMSVPRILVLSPFKALRQLYWLMDRDAEIRSQGLQTVGSVTDTRTDSRVVRDCEGGERTVRTHYVTYRFDADGGTYSGEKTVRNLGYLRRGSRIKVYYLPDTYPPDSAIDRAPRGVA